MCGKKCGVCVVVVCCDKYGVLKTQLVCCGFWCVVVVCCVCVVVGVL